MGGLSEKLLTLEEAARQLHLSTDAIEALIRQGRLPAFRLGGQHLRIRLADLMALDKDRSHPPPASAKAPAPSVSRRGEEKSSVSVAPSEVSSGGASLWDRVVDFLYFHDFYLIGILIFLTLLAIIFLL